MSSVGSIEPAIFHYRKQQKMPKFDVLKPMYGYRHV